MLLDDSSSSEEEQDNDDLELAMSLILSREPFLLSIIWTKQFPDLLVALC
jgi:hypothetical protein